MQTQQVPQAGASPAGSRAWQDLFAFTRANLGVFLTATIAVSVVWRLIAVSGYDMNTAKAILQISGTTNVAVGGLLASLPTLCGLGYWLSVIPSRRWTRGKSSVERSALSWASSLTALVAVWIVPIWLFIGPPVVFGVLNLIARLIRKRRIRRGVSVTRPEDRVSRFEGGAVLTGIVILALWTTLASPWLPTERLSVGGGHAFTGYVIGERGGQTILLPDDGKQVLEAVPTSQLSRELCSKPNLAAETFRDLMSGHRYPRCP
ncbi:MAG: hypothetical protein FWD74_00485 [Actinomycetia bacterium]|nr:hypothetical protein [Actinomycetes bacterium]